MSQAVIAAAGFVGRNDILPAIIVIVEEASPPANRVRPTKMYAGRFRLIGESAIILIL